MSKVIQNKAKYSRQKGVAFERHVAECFRRVGYPHAKRHLEFQVEEAKGIDLDHTGRFKVQCKKLASYVSVNTIQEIKCDEFLGDVPVLVTAGTNQRAMVVLPFDSFLELLNDLNREINENA